MTISVKCRPVTSGGRALPRAGEEDAGLDNTDVALQEEGHQALVTGSMNNATCYCSITRNGPEIMSMTTQPSDEREWCELPGGRLTQSPST